MQFKEKRVKNVYELKSKKFNRFKKWKRLLIRSVRF